MGKRFRVALSFSGDRRAFVEAVAAELATALGGQDRVLYDYYHEAEFARPDLDLHLQDLYHNQSDLVVVFLSAEYERRPWCGVEWRVMRTIIMGKRSEDLMFFRFDNAEIPGIFPLDGYSWIGDRSPREVADLILKRMAVPRPAASARPRPGVVVGGHRLIWENPLVDLANVRRLKAPFPLEGPLREEVLRALRVAEQGLTPLFMTGGGGEQVYQTDDGLTYLREVCDNADGGSQRRLLMAPVPAAATFCPVCKKVLPSGANFCADCGSTEGRPVAAVRALEGEAPKGAGVVAYARSCEACGTTAIGFEAKEPTCLGCGKPWA
jgi:hypothetical protein